MAFRIGGKMYINRAKSVKDKELNARSSNRFLIAPNGAVTGDFASIMNAKRLIIEPNRPVHCFVIRQAKRRLMTMQGAGLPVTAALISLSLRRLINVTGDPEWIVLQLHRRALSR